MHDVHRTPQVPVDDKRRTISLIVCKAENQNSDLIDKSYSHYYIDPRDLS
jgi:hypothetical protein